MSDLAQGGVAYAEANHGRWVARCPRPWCTNAMDLERCQEAFHCEGLDGCGMSATVLWPPDPEAIEAILMQRPVPRTRNWLAGQPLQDLLQENLSHGVLPPEWDVALEPGEQLVIADIVDERVVGGLLHKQLVAADPRREIGV